MISRIASIHSRYHISGFALWGRQREYGPNIGEFDLVMEFQDGRLIPIGSAGNTESHRINIVVFGEMLTVTEENWLVAYGLNVYFKGEYRKAK